ncbi:MFS general substrate transporter [Punctularia strigosozonata HHB-11173 SS5]|uniref:MFS general substrate transporter n=1 Tax=Punctularia strigosozonata (strain HHB-11173) TaxID=741275 RepID=UPI0004417E16|nr:MFS general substrate transporter [Punctularia strigosozonata HHB-11173 SS5]EIN14738.1 MFS general substrate transporter [Punctularia strigosozonata HHB-11173 SS5]
MSETQPLLATERPPVKKAWYRPRPLWLVPFALLSAVVRGMTLAPRVQVYTQLACDAVYERYNHTNASHQASSAFSTLDVLSAALDQHSLSPDSLSRIIFNPRAPSPQPLPWSGPTSGHEPATHNHRPSSPGIHVEPEPIAKKPRSSNPCLRDPAVQSGAARIQAVMMTTMGTMSAITTAWWGHFGERKGRTRVLAMGCLGMFVTDSIFVLVSHPHSALSRPEYGQVLLVIAPFIEGLLGGWSSMQATTSAYVADCTSDGSRAHIFSRFIGIMFLGVSFGPALGGFFIRNPIPLPYFQDHTLPISGTKTVTSVFVIAATISFVNFLFTAFVVPESRNKHNAKATPAIVVEQAADEEQALLEEERRIIEDDEEAEIGGTDVVGTEVFFSPTRSMSRVHTPVAVPAASAATSQQPLPDRAVAELEKQGHIARILLSFAFFLPRRVADPRKMGVTKMDYSMTWLGAALFGYLLSTGLFQIKYLYAEHAFEWGAEQLSIYITIAAGVRMVYTLLVMPFFISTFKPKPAKITSESLAKEMAFDLALVRVSLVIDILSNALVALVPSTPALFTFLSVLSGFGSGVVPALQSLALCIVQRSETFAAADSKTVSPGAGKGQLFGAMASVQAIGQQIIGPIVFGVLYANTVGTYPKAIFVAAAGILFVALVLVCFLRPPYQPASSRPKISPQAQQTTPSQSKGKKRRVRDAAEIDRGRSRATKDLRPDSGSEGFYGSLGSSVGASTSFSGTPASASASASGPLASGSGSGSRPSGA